MLPKRTPICLRLNFLRNFALVPAWQARLHRRHRLHELVFRAGRGGRDMAVRQSLQTSDHRVGQPQRDERHVELREPF
jgi:hypothetical protein